MINFAFFARIRRASRDVNVLCVVRRGVRHHTYPSVKLNVILIRVYASVGREDVRSINVIHLSSET